MLTIPKPSLRLLAALAAALALSGCTTQGDAGATHGERHRHKTDGAPMMGGHSGGGSTAAGTGEPSGSRQMDMQAMCGAYGRMRDAPPGQHEPMLEQHMKDMSPEMRERHMEMLRQHCK